VFNEHFYALRLPLDIRKGNIVPWHKAARPAAGIARQKESVFARTRATFRSPQKKKEEKRRLSLEPPFAFNVDAAYRRIGSALHESPEKFKAGPPVWHRAKICEHRGTSICLYGIPTLLRNLCYHSGLRIYDCGPIIIFRLSPLRSSAHRRNSRFAPSLSRRAAIR
jgi:hypothetical protein